MDKRIEAQQVDLRLLTNSVSTLNNCVMNQSHSLLVLNNSLSLQENKIAVDNALMYKMLFFNTLLEEKRELAKAEMLDLQRQSKEIEEKMGGMRAAARGLVVPSLPQPKGGHELAPVTSTNTTVQAVQPSQVASMTQVHPTSIKEAPPKRRSARSSGRGTQASKSTSAKRRETGDTLVVSLASQETAVLDEDVDMVPESQEQVSSLINTTVAQTETTLRQVMEASMAREQLLDTSSVDSRTCSHIVSCQKVALCFSLVLHYLVMSMKTLPGWILMIAFLAMFVQESTASMTGNGISLYALNANGMVNLGKMSQISSALKIHRPHILTISEMKTSDKVGNKLDVEDYNFFKETGVKMDNHHLYKWGIVVGVRRDIQVVQQVQVSKTLEGRVVALDLVMGTNTGRGFIHRFIGVYAPWNPGSDTNDTSFWNEVTKICNQAAFSWSIAGDLNATVSTTERASGGNDARRHRIAYAGRKTVEEGDGGAFGQDGSRRRCKKGLSSQS
jgi:hypothetical protein